MPQFKIIRESIEAFGLDVIEKKDFEADDIIAILVKKYAPHEKVLIVSGDKDFFSF